MTTIIHVLGASIPHHNQTLLHFFNDVLFHANQKEKKSLFMLVADAKMDLLHYPNLIIDVFPNKKQLAGELVQRAKQDRSIKFFFHGQFNPYLWLAFLLGRIKPSQIYWHVWGADLYEDRQSVKYRCYYLFRRLAQRRVNHIFATYGDLQYVQKKGLPAKQTVLYFPTRVTFPSSSAQRELMPVKDGLTLLVGNSGDISNRHLAALSMIYDNFGQHVRLIIPMGYPDNNQKYIQQVKNKAISLFLPENVNILENKIDFFSYQKMLSQCHMGFFIFERQQGIGTLCLLIALGIPFVLNKKNLFINDLKQQHIPFFSSEQMIDEKKIEEVRDQLLKLDLMKITFFPANYEQNWLSVLTDIEEDK